MESAEFQIRIVLLALAAVFLALAAWQLAHQSFGSLFTRALCFTIPAASSDVLLAWVIAVVGDLLTY